MAASHRPSALNLTAEERTAYSYLFAKADTDQIGVLIGEKAVAFFANSKLAPTILGEIWQLADQDNAGFLTRPQFDIALRLIGKAQRGVPINQAAISTPGPLCRLEGFSIPGLPATHSPISSSSHTPVPSPAIQLGDPIPEQDKIKYARMFMNASPKDGLLEGEKARDIFIKSNLPFEKLAQIWSLADTQSRGSLTVGDFSIAMHLIQLCMSGRISTLPAQLPPSLLESSIITPSLTRALSPQMTGFGSQRQSTISGSVRPQYTGQAPLPSNLNPLPPASAHNILPSSPAIQPPSISPSQQQQWDITPAELSQSNIFFDTLDPMQQGFVTGERAVPFMMESKLSGDILAQIWDLADVRGEGQLNREEFAVAMRLIQDTIAAQAVGEGGKGSAMMPKTLPLSMVPPSLRDGRGVPSAGISSSLQQTSDTQKDLLSLMDDDEVSTSPPAIAQRHASTPLINTSQFSQAHALSAQVTGSGTTTVPPIARIASPSSSNFGVMPNNNHNLPRQLTGQVSHPTAFEDTGARLGNLYNQVASTETGLAQLRTEHARLDSDISNTSEQIRLLESKLSVARTTHQNETLQVESLRNKQAEQRAILKGITEEVIRAESELSGLKIEKDQLEGNILRDKEEVRDLKKKMNHIEDQTKQMRIKLESLRKDARLQMGLVAIGKKQVATSESQRELVEKELAAAQQEALPVARDAGVSGGGGTTRSISPVHDVLARTASSSTPKSTNPFASMVFSSPSAKFETLPSVSGVGKPDVTEAVGHEHKHTDGLEDNNAPVSVGPSGSPEGQQQQTPRPQASNAFDDAFATTEDVPRVSTPAITLCDDHSPSLKPNTTSLTTGQQTSSSEKNDQPSRDDDNDTSSDEDEAEDPTGGNLNKTTLVKTLSSADLKFPPIPDVELNTAATTINTTTMDQSSADINRPGTLTAVHDKFFSARSGIRKNSASPEPPEVTTVTAATTSSSHDFHSTSGGRSGSGFGDSTEELEISDFAADFGLGQVSEPSLAKAHPSNATNTTMDDFDSAFANLPLPSSRPSASVGTGKTNVPGGAFGSSPFDDAFGDDFVVVKAQNDQNHQNQAQTFDDAFSGFDDAFTRPPAPPIAVGGGRPATGSISSNHSNVAKELGSSGASAGPIASTSTPPLPPRSTVQRSSSLVEPGDIPKDNDSDAVKQICAMGFPRSVAIEALKRDEGDVERALNHLLGV